MILFFFVSHQVNLLALFLLSCTEFSKLGTLLRDETECDRNSIMCLVIFAFDIDTRVDFAVLFHGCRIYLIWNIDFISYVHLLNLFCFIFNYVHLCCFSILVCRVAKLIPIIRYQIQNDPRPHTKRSRVLACRSYLFFFNLFALLF